MEITRMDAKKRENATKVTRNQIKKDNMIPAVLYGGKDPNVILAIDEKVWHKLFDEHNAANLVLDLIIDGDADNPELIKIGEIQRCAMTERLKHVDFIRLERGVKSEFEVPIEFVGRSEGQKAGGMLTLSVDHIKVECFPRNVPDKVAIDITNFKLGDKFHVSDLQWDNADVEILTDPKQLLFIIDIPRVKAEAEVAPAEGEEEEGAEGAEKKGGDEKKKDEKKK